jgi:hypothetical protein
MVIVCKQRELFLGGGKECDGSDYHCRPFVFRGYGEEVSSALC